MKQQQSFENRTDGPIYISIEPWPECFELEPNDKLTISHQVTKNEEAIQVDFINKNELVIWPGGDVDHLEILFNGKSAEGKSWNFKHRSV